MREREGGGKVSFFFFLFEQRKKKKKKKKEKKLTTALLLGSRTATMTALALTATSSWTTSIAELPVREREKRFLDREKKGK